MEKLNLDDLHDQYMEGMTETSLLTYLLNSSLFLRNANLMGWLERFRPSLIPAPPKPPTPKRKRGVPDAMLYRPAPLCEECKGETWEDVMGGCVVCMECGLIQPFAVHVPDAHINTSGTIEWHTTRRVVHRYSRLVYFRSLLMGLQGETTPTLTDQELSQIKSTCSELTSNRSNKNATSKDVRIAIRANELPRRHMRHAVQIAFFVSRKESVSLDLTGEQQRKFMRLFRALECVWDHDPRVRCGRVYFMSYSFLITQMCKLFGVTSHSPSLIKNKKSTMIQTRIFDSMCANVDMSRF
jgi:hypothetical protein